MKITRLLKTTIGTALLAGALLLAPQAAQARVFISVGFAPPAIPVYTQPICPGDGYIWTPGYWQYTDEGYQWVDGAWVLAPYTGALWTPGYWGYGPGGYFWNAGYWGPTVGYYGGINYGFGYFGVGFYGGYWSHGAFFYNRAYNHFGPGGGFHNVYNRPVAGFDGRPGGASFARGVSNVNRGSSFANNTNRGGFGSTAMRSNFGPGANGFRGTSGNEVRGTVSAVNRGGFGQSAQPRAGNSFNGRAAGPASGARPSLGGGNRGGNAAPRASSGGGSHGGGGGHGGGHR
jgi:hypothetical protein